MKRKLVFIISFLAMTLIVLASCSEPQQNVPGTDRDRYPNWRLKLPVNLEDMENMLAYYRNIAAVKKER